MTTVYVDVDTQLDFLYPAGALPVPGAARLLPAIGRLNRHANDSGCPVLSTMDAHFENDPEFRDWPPHCVKGTLGQGKPATTLLDERIVVPSVAGEYAISQARQILLEKQALDCFTNPNLSGILNRLGAERYLVYGVATEYCVRLAALGLLATGGRVALVTDAIQGLREEDARKTIEEVRAAGGELTTVEQILAS